MRPLVLVAVILLLPLVESNGDYSFGDIISFERHCPCIPTLTYKHFAVYVDSVDMGDKKKPDQDIFQRTGPVTSLIPLSLSNCIFDKLENERGPGLFGGLNTERKDNYLDGILDFIPGTNEEIKERILARHGKCGTYGPFGNNCEHLATYIRYGKCLSLQTGLSVENFCKNKDPQICDRVEEIRQSIENEKKCLEAKCSTSDKSNG